jgi:hypothetical protein
MSLKSLSKLCVILHNELRRKVQEFLWIAKGNVQIYAGCGSNQRRQMSNDANVRTSEPVNRLPVVAYHVQSSVSALRSKFLKQAQSIF